MFRNQYDSDVTVWSPQGRLHQVEYAMEAVKLGSATVGLKSKDYAVLVAILRAASELSSSQRKIIPIDDHIGISIAGITADARVLSRHLRTECLNYKYSYGVPHPVSKLITNLGNKMQITTQRYDRRPYGVGLLVAGYDDEKGPRIYQVVPSANFFNCKAMSIGSRSQSSRTYLERHLASFNDCSKDELICHGVQAIRGSLPNEELGKDDKSSLLNISIAIVGRDQPFKILDDNENLFYVNMAKQRGAAIVPSRSDDDIRPPGPDDESPRTPPTDPDVIVAAMDQ